MLSKWGFQIYGCIDAYSRNIVWIYVGIFNRMAQSVLRQYLITCSSLGFQPKIIRSDRRKETLLCAEVHLHLLIRYKILILKLETVSFMD